MGRVRGGITSWSRGFGVGEENNTALTLLYQLLECRLHLFVRFDFAAEVFKSDCFALLRAVGWCCLHLLRFSFSNFFYCFFWCSRCSWFRSLFLLSLWLGGGSFLGWRWCWRGSRSLAEFDHAVGVRRRLPCRSYARGLSIDARGGELLEFSRGYSDTSVLQLITEQGTRMRALRYRKGGLFVRRG